MSLRINDTAPDFTADTTAGPIKFHDWIGDGYAVLFSNARDPSRCRRARVRQSIGRNPRPSLNQREDVVADQGLRQRGDRLPDSHLAGQLQRDNPVQA